MRKQIKALNEAVLKGQDAINTIRDRGFKVGDKIYFTKLAHYKTKYLIGSISTIDKGLNGFFKIKTHPQGDELVDLKIFKGTTGTYVGSLKTGYNTYALFDLSKGGQTLKKIPIDNVVNYIDDGKAVFEPVKDEDWEW